MPSSAALQAAAKPAAPAPTIKRSTDFKVEAIAVPEINGSTESDRKGLLNMVERFL